MILIKRLVCSHHGGGTKRGGKPHAQALPPGERTWKHRIAEIRKHADAARIPEGNHLLIDPIGDGELWQALAQAPLADAVFLKGISRPRCDDFHGAPGTNPVSNTPEHRLQSLADGVSAMVGAGLCQRAIEPHTNPARPRVARTPEIFVELVTL
jgi:hypothetical protein